MHRRRKCHLLLATVSMLAPTVVAGAQHRGEALLERVMSARYDTHAGARLTVDVADADLVLRDGPSDSVEIAVWLRAHDMERARRRFEAMNFRADGNDDAVSISSDRDREWSWNWRSWGRFGITVEITLPEQYDVDVRTGDGDVQIAALQGQIRIETSDGDIGADRLVGDVRVSTSDGDVAVRNTAGTRIEIRTSDGDLSFGELRADTVTLRTSDGDISSAAISAREAEARTSDGDIVLGGVTGPLSAHTTDGSIHIAITELGDTSLSSGDGDITIEADASLAADLDLSGQGLDMHDAASFDGTRTRRVIRGDLNGGGPRLSARTGDGSVLLTFRRDG